MVNERTNGTAAGRTFWARNKGQKIDSPDLTGRAPRAWDGMRWDEILQYMDKYLSCLPPSWVEAAGSTD